MVKILNEYPPIFEKVKARFDLTGKKPAFAYGGVIYNPFDGFIDEAMIEHERVHFVQQEEVGGAEIWWDMYLEDPEFRLKQEIPAYRVQWKYIDKNNKDREFKNMYLTKIVDDLSGPMYGNMLSRADAKKLITQK